MVSEAERADGESAHVYGAEKKIEFFYLPIRPQVPFIYNLAAWFVIMRARW